MPLSVRTPSREHRVGKEDTVDDSVDVPAAVVCAACGDAACAGCGRELSRSGIVAIVAWERPGASVLARLWATARATTLSGEGFFDVLPDGPIAPALRFAILAELVAAVGLLVVALPLVVAFAPAWAKYVLFDARARDEAMRLLVVGIPSLALLLVLAHAAHGLALDYGARRAGATSARGRALRFGLYAAGWDLVLGPIGAVVLAAREGLGAAGALLPLGIALPGKCARAFLRGYGLEGARAEKAAGSATAAAIAATIIGAVVIVVAAGFVVMGAE